MEFRKCTKCNESFPATSEYFWANKKGKFPDKKRAHLIKCLYNLSIQEYDNILEPQKGVCAICGKIETAKDSNGNIRPLLSAIRYLEEWNG